MQQTWGDERRAYNILIGKSERNSWLGRSGITPEDNIGTNLREAERERE
jgi:hypothetical protein